MECFIPIKKRELGLASTKYQVYKCQYSALFAFLGIDRYDAATIYNLLDKVDESYTDKITFSSIANAFCKPYKEVFFVISYHYHQCYSKINNINESVDETNNKGDRKLALSGGVTTYDAEAAHNIIINRYYLICFLLHFLSISDDKMVEFIYWLLFKGQNKSTNIVDVTLHHVDLFWTNQLDLPFVENNRKKLEELCKGSDAEGITAYRLQLFDLRAGNILSKMVTNLKKALIKALGGKALWLRFAGQVENKLVNVEESYENLLQFPHHFVHDDNNRTNEHEREFILKAERKGARRNLRAFIRVLIHYRDMSSAETDEMQLLFSNGPSLFSRVFRYLPKLSKGKQTDSASQSPQKASTFNYLQQIFGKLPIATNSTTHDNYNLNWEGFDDQASTMSLERRYGDALQLSIRQIRRNVKEWYLEGVAAVEQIDQFLLENALSENQNSQISDDHSLTSKEKRKNYNRRASTATDRSNQHNRDDDSSIASMVSKQSGLNDNADMESISRDNESLASKNHGKSEDSSIASGVRGDENAIDDEQDVENIEEESDEAESVEKDSVKVPQKSKSKGGKQNDMRKEQNHESDDEDIDNFLRQR